jgi:RNA polymerase sigma factor (sigma-70 family)
MNTDQAREKAEISRVTQENWANLKRFFRSKVPAPDCYDLVQETLLGFVRRGTAGIEDPRGYLWKIAYNKLNSYLRDKCKAPTFDSERQSVLAPETSLSVRFDRRNQLANALRSLPVAYQTAFELRYGEQLEQTEIAAALGIHISTVKRHLERARELLKEALLANGVQPTPSAIDEVAEQYKKG